MEDEKFRDLMVENDQIRHGNLKFSKDKNNIDIFLHLFTIKY